MNEKNLKQYLRKLLSERKILFLSFCSSDLTYREIGEKMGIKKRTAEHYADDIADRLGVCSKEKRIALAKYAFRAGLDAAH